MRWCVVAAMVVVLFPVVVEAQVTARHDDSGDTDTQIKSPMVLEVPLIVANPERWNGQWVVSPEPLKRFVCDNVSIVSLRLRAEKPSATGSVRLMASMTFKNAPGHDKLVDVRLVAIRNDAEVSGGIRAKNIDVEEGRIATRDAVFAISADELKKEPLPLLRLTVSVREN